LRLLTLPEHSRRAYLPLDPTIAQAMGGTGLVAVGDSRDGRTVLRSTNRVGAVRVGSGQEAVEVRVRPKIPIARLLWLLGYARNQAGWHEESFVGLAEERDLVPAVAVSFTAAAAHALAPGVLQGYRDTEEALQVLRGRFRESEQLRIRLGLAVPLEVRYDDYTIDIPENQILLSAALRLLRLPGVRRATLAALRRFTVALAGVAPLVPGRRAPDTLSTRLTQRYQPALRLARLILAGDSVEHPPGGVDAAGFVFNLDKVFEDWLFGVLRDALQMEYGGHVEDQHLVHLDDERGLDMYPDITWWAGEHCLAVADAKYKAPAGRPPREDIYQMLAYCTALGLSTGHLVYAAGYQGPPAYRIPRTDVTIAIHALDLSAPLHELRRQIDRFARSLHAEQAGAALSFTPRLASLREHPLVTTPGRDLRNDNVFVGGHDGKVQRFLDDDSGYLQWLATHRDGFVINTYRKPTGTYLVLHRATCRTISGTPAVGSRWTVDYAKFCGGRSELEAFARNEVGGEPRICGRCV